MSVRELGDFLEGPYPLKQPEEFIPTRQNLELPTQPTSRKTQGVTIDPARQIIVQKLSRIIEHAEKKIDAKRGAGKSVDTYEGRLLNRLVNLYEKIVTNQEDPKKQEGYRATFDWVVRAKCSEEVRETFFTWVKSTRKASSQARPITPREAPQTAPPPTWADRLRKIAVAGAKEIGKLFLGVIGLPVVTTARTWMTERGHGRDPSASSMAWIFCCSLVGHQSSMFRGSPE